MYLTSKSCNSESIDVTKVYISSTYIDFGVDLMTEVYLHIHLQLYHYRCLYIFQAGLIQSFLYILRNFNSLYK